MDLPIDIITQILIDIPYSDMARLCQSNKRISKICSDRSFLIYTHRLKKEYPDIPLIGDPVSHYRKIVRGIGTQYHIMGDPDEPDDFLEISQYPLPDENIIESFIVPGNTYPSGTHIYVSAFKHYKDEPYPMTENSVNVSFDLFTTHKLLKHKLTQCVLYNYKLYNYTIGGDDYQLGDLSTKDGLEELLYNIDELNGIKGKNVSIFIETSKGPIHITIFSVNLP